MAASPFASIHLEPKEERDRFLIAASLISDADCTALYIFESGMIEASPATLRSRASIELATALKSHGARNVSFVKLPDSLYADV
jgi:hypothetical protein